MSLTVSAGLQALSKYLKGIFPGADVALQVFDFLASTVIISGLFAAIYKVLPDKPITWRDVAIGALATTLPVRGRQVSDRALCRPEQCCLVLRRGWRPDRASAVDLLHGADLPAGRRVHPRLCQTPRQPRGR